MTMRELHKRWRNAEAMARTAGKKAQGLVFEYASLAATLQAFKDRDGAEHWIQQAERVAKESQ